MNIVMYSTGCPKCRILKMKLDASGLPYTIHDDIDEMMSLGFRSVPVLYVDGEFFTFQDAVRWVNDQLPPKPASEERTSEEQNT